MDPGTYLPRAGRVRDARRRGLELDAFSDDRPTVELLGPPRITVGGEPLEVDTRKAIALLAVLAASGRMSRESLATLFWPDSERERGRGALRRTLSVLNSGLKGHGLVADRTHVSLDPEAFSIDLAEFEALVARADEHAHTEPSACDDCLALLARAVDLHRGPFLQGFTVRENPEFMDWADARGEHHRRELCEVLDRLTRGEIEFRRFDEAVAHAQRWLEADPLNEKVHTRLMLLHAWRGERAVAVRCYRELVGLLDRELGVAPLRSTTRAYEAILEGRVDTGRVPRPRRERASASNVRHAADLPFVGRASILADVQEHLTRGGAAALIEGEAGVGKTRFVEELEARFHRAGTGVLPTRCHPGDERVAFSPVIDLLRAVVVPGRTSGLPGWVVTEVQRLVPDAVSEDTPPPVALDTPGAQQRFYEAIGTALAVGARHGELPGVVMVEDVHAADDATLEFIAHLCDRLDEHQLGLVLTFRGEAVDPGHGLHHLLHLDLAHVAQWSLPRLEPSAVTEMVEPVLGDVDGTQAIIDRLVLETEGLPLALVEYVRWLVDHRPSDPGADWPIPSGVRELVEKRLSGLTDTATQLISAAAVIGHDIAPDVVGAAAGRTDEEVVDGLDELVQRGLLVASGDLYDFSHEKIRTIAYETTSPARRRLLHGRVADALAPKARRLAEGQLAGVVAEHALRGGREESAAFWSVLAGDHALTLLANTEANEHYERALALGHDDPSVVHRRLARSRLLMGDYPGALENYEAAAAHARDEDELAEVEHELGVLHLRRGNWGLAEAHLTTAQARLRTSDPTAAARAMADLGLLSLNQGDLGSADQRAHEALELAERAEDRHALAQARNLAGLVARRLGNITEAHRQLEHAAALAATLPDPTAYIAALNNLALSMLDAGEHARAEQLLRTALDRCERQGDRHRQAAILNNLADLHHLRGDEDETMTLLKEAVGLFAEVGSTSPQEPEIWKLTEW